MGIGIDERALFRADRGRDRDFPRSGSEKKEGVRVEIRRPRGTQDILPGAVEAWQALEAVVRDVFERANYEEIRTPIFEHTELFERGVGETTDIVSKEMYTFLDRGGRSVTLRPEGTAGVVRAYVENKLYGQGSLTKVYYLGPMFRYEKPQRGRLRQLHQVGVEVLGSELPAIDAEVIELGYSLLKRVGMRDMTVELNSVGCGVCRPRHREKMIERLLPHKGELCGDCQVRLEKNPLRLFDCKNESCQQVLREADVPYIVDELCDDCRQHLDAVEGYLRAMDVPYRLEKSLVRGLDYYTRTAWEITVPNFSTVLGGGRYNRLVAELGGPEVPGIGFAAGMDRVLAVLEAQGVALGERPPLDAYICVADETAEHTAMAVLTSLRRLGVRCDRDYQGRSLKSQFKQADRLGARFAVVIGESELAKGAATVKHLATGEQRDVPFGQLADRIREGGWT